MQQDDLISLLLFFQNKESGLKMRKKVKRLIHMLLEDTSCLRYKTIKWLFQKFHVFQIILLL
jgi:hypothetical protein